VVLQLGVPELVGGPDDAEQAEAVGVVEESHEPEGAAVDASPDTVDPDGAESRHQTARRDRRVVITPEVEVDEMIAMIQAVNATAMPA